MKGGGDVWQEAGGRSSLHPLDTAVAVADRTCLEGYTFCRPHLSECGGSKGVHEWECRLEGHSLVVIGVAEPNCDRKADIHQQVHKSCPFL